MLPANGILWAKQQGTPCEWLSTINGEQTARRNLSLAQRAPWTASLKLSSAAVSIICNFPQRRKDSSTPSLLHFPHGAEPFGEESGLSLSGRRDDRREGLCAGSNRSSCGVHRIHLPSRTLLGGIFTPSFSTVVQDNPLQRIRPTARRSRGGKLSFGNWQIPGTSPLLTILEWKYSNTSTTPPRP